MSKDQSHHSAPRRSKARFKVRIFNPFPSPFGEKLFGFLDTVFLSEMGFLIPGFTVSSQREGNAEGI